MPLSAERFAWLSAFALLMLIVAAIALSHQAAAIQGDNAYEQLSLIDGMASLPPLFPLRSRDYVGYALAIAGLMIAAGGGIGGGGKQYTTIKLN
jgi:hypothetical protein